MNQATTNTTKVHLAQQLTRKNETIETEKSENGLKFVAINLAEVAGTSKPISLSLSHTHIHTDAIHVYIYIHIHILSLFLSLSLHIDAYT